MGFKIFPDDIGGILPDWIYDLYRDDDGDALKDAGPHIKWLYALYKKENRLDRMVGLLVSRGQELERRVAELDGIANERLANILQLEGAVKERESKILQLNAEPKSL